MDDGARARIARAVTGMVAGGYAVEYDLAAGAIPCSQCERALSASDEVTAAVFDYEGHTWELAGVYCREHGVETVGAAMAGRTDERAVVAATLEPTGYRDPTGQHHPDAVSLGGVEVLDHRRVAYE
jgi:hypothetical protein